MIDPKKVHQVLGGEASPAYHIGLQVESAETNLRRRISDLRVRFGKIEDDIETGRPVSDFGFASGDMIGLAEDLGRRNGALRALGVLGVDVGGLLEDQA